MRLSIMPTDQDQHPEVTDAEDTDLSITTIRQGHTTTVVVAGEIGLANATQLSAAGLHAVAVTPGELVIDLREVTFMDSSGLGHLTRVLRAAPTTPTRVLVNHRRVAALFRITGMARVCAVEQLPPTPCEGATSSGEPPSDPVRTPGV